MDTKLYLDQQTILICVNALYVGVITYKDINKLSYKVVPPKVPSNW